MNCPKCGMPIPPNVGFCRQCGTPIYQPAPVVYGNPVPAKKGSAKKVIGIILLILSVASFLFSLSDNAKLIGKWRIKDFAIPQNQYSYFLDVPRPPVELKNMIFEFSLFGKFNISGISNGVQGIMPGSYQMSHNILTLQMVPMVSQLEPTTLYFMNHDTIILDGNAEYPLHRTDSIAFYVVVMVLSVVMAVVGLILLLQKQHPAVPAGPTPYVYRAAPVRPVPPTYGANPSVVRQPVSPDRGTPPAQPQQSPSDNHLQG